MFCFFGNLNIHLRPWPSGPAFMMCPSELGLDSHFSQFLFWCRCTAGFWYTAGFAVWLVGSAVMHACMVGCRQARQSGALQALGALMVVCCWHAPWHAANQQRTGCSWSVRGYRHAEQRRTHIHTHTHISNCMHTRSSWAATGWAVLAGFWWAGLLLGTHTRSGVHYCPHTH